jgi:putative membrane protein
MNGKSSMVSKPPPFLLSSVEGLRQSFSAACYCPDAMTTTDSRIVLDTSTKLAVERTRLAYERTLMAWVRTGVSLISFGFTIYKFFEEFHKGEQIPRSSDLFGAREFGLVMISIGLLVVLLATIQHVRIMHKLRAQYVDVPYSLAALVALLVSVLGILALIAVFFRQ